MADLSCGTALAYVLRSAGYGLAPRAAGELRYDVVKAAPELEIWPVGVTSPQAVQEKLPVPGGSLVIERHVFPTDRQQPCLRIQPSKPRRRQQPR